LTSLLQGFFIKCESWASVCYRWGAIDSGGFQKSKHIESVSVLKDAASTSIYGAEVQSVIITTKKKGILIAICSSYGVSEFRGDDYNLTNAKQL
jgi:hypothetical protein